MRRHFSIVSRPYSTARCKKRRKTTMKIAIIGTGHIGGTLTRRLTKLGHQVSIANSRGPQTLADLAAETGATPGVPRDIVQGADIVIVTIPQKNIPNLPKDLFANVPETTVVIDTGNYYPKQRDGKIEEIEAGMPESRWVEKQLGRPVIKVFNNIYAKHLLEKGVPAGTPGRIALPVAGDDPVAKQKVMQLVDELGFDPVDAGTLDESWRQQPGTPCYGADLDAKGLKEALQAASPVRTAEWRA
ncbi:NADPH-dependent F420 reductase [Alicyclobacillus cycloheptanicus]|nr:NADPH-dependent F420 reductase [Alicyclobacillus cycloheptanicus]